MNTTVLFAPQSYRQINKADDEFISIKEQVCNGCGAKGFGWACPDRIWFLDISEACNIHDWMYYLGEDLADKEEADRVFANNVSRLIKAAHKDTFFGRILTNLRYRRANKYIWAVQNLGGPAFWDGKNDEEDEILVDILEK